MKVKLITIFLLAVSAVVLVGYISYEGLSKLMLSLEATTKPDYRKDHFNELIYALSEAENSVRVYTITRESGYLEPFYSSINEVDHQMDILYRYAKGDHVLAEHLDTIHNLIEKKIRLQKKLIELKEDLSQIDVYQHVLDKIQTIEKKNERLDSLEQEITRLNTEEKFVEKKEEEQEEKKEKKGFFRRLFGSNKKEEEPDKEIENFASATDSISSKVDTLTQIMDTLKKEKFSAEIKHSLVEIKAREQEISKDLTQAELYLTKKDQEISDLIKLEVSKVEEHFDLAKIHTAEQASDLFEETTQLIKIVGTVSAMMFLILVFIILNDIQVNQRFRKRLEHAKKRAEDLAAAKEDFLSNMSHEIRTPMNAILGFAEQLGIASPPQDQQKYVKIIKNASQHLLSIINDILDYNKLEAGKIKIEKIPFSVEENCNMVFDTLLINARNKDLEFKLDIEKPLLKHYLKGDPVRFRQILFNLAGNAIKFTDKGFVHISITYVDAEKPHVQVVVKDSGIGMSAKELAVIFNKFDQADQSISKKYGGTGLGLAIVKKLADLQNGRVDVESEPGKGSEFRVHLPYHLTDKKIEKTGSKAAKPEKTRLQNSRILIVDDEEYNVLLFDTILRKYHAKTSTASSGVEALEKIAKEKFDLILMDLQMKGLDGFQTLAKVKEDATNKTPIVAITASVSQAIHDRCKKAGFVDVILKPVKERKFIELLDKYFDEPAVSLEGEQKTMGKIPENLRQVFELVQNDEALALNMINIYVKNVQKTCEIFRQASNSDDYSQIREAAHKIIPSTRHMGFEELVDKLKFAENNISIDGDISINRKHIEEMCSDMDTIVKRLQDFLKEYEFQNSVVS